MSYNFQTASGFSYTVKEALGLGVPCIVTPIPTMKEQKVVEGKTGYYMPFDMKDCKVERLKKIPEFEPFIIQDKWNTVLLKGKSDYQELLKKRYRVRATQGWYNLRKDCEELGHRPAPNEVWETDYIHKEEYVEQNLVTDVKEIN